MIRAAKNPIGDRLVWQLVHGALVKQFSTVRLRLSEPLSDELEHSSTVYYVNHSSWWDGYLCMVLERFAFHRQPTYLMMEERNLRRYRFFSWAGAFGVDRDDPRAALTSIDYAVSLLREQPGRGMYIFPQGTMLPNDRRPLYFFSGTARLATHAAKLGPSPTPPVRLVPVAMRLEFVQEQRPDAFISVGPARVLDPMDLPHPRMLNAEMTETLTNEVDRLRDTIIAEQFDDFAIVLRGKQGVDRIFDRLASRGRRESRRAQIEGRA